MFHPTNKIPYNIPTSSKDVRHISLKKLKTHTISNKPHYVINEGCVGSMSSDDSMVTKIDLNKHRSSKTAKPQLLY